MRAKVLIVDDQPDLLAGISLLLREQDIDVEIHDSMITLPLVVRQINPDLVLIDLSMPALSGSAIFRVGRSRLRTDAPLVIFSGRGEETLAKNVEELGADGYIAKSREPQEIIARIQSWIDHCRAVRAAREEEVA